MQRLKAIAQSLKVEAHTAWLCARDENVPWPVRLFGLAIAAYALSPIDLIPDFIPVLGLLDEALLIPAALWLFLKLVPADVYARNKAIALKAAHRPISRAGAAAILSIWLVAIGATVMVVHRAYQA